MNIEKIDKLNKVGVYSMITWHLLGAFVCFTFQESELFIKKLSYFMFWTAWYHLLRRINGWDSK